MTTMLGCLTLFTNSSPAEVIIAENFGGAGGDLNSTTADIFSSAITSAGGSATWAAAGGFKDDGSVSPVFNQSAYLPVGSYINATKGKASGLFTLSATLTLSTTGSWGSIGFFRNPVTNRDFTQNSIGLATLIYRTSGELDGFGGPGSLNNVDGPDAQSGPQLLTVVLDLTGHDNSTNFGSVSFYQGTVDPGNLLGTYHYTADYSFDAIGLSQAQYNGTYSGLQLVQDPYGTWAAGYAPADLRNKAGDYDGDTLTNLQEFAFGTNPTVSTGAITIDGSGNVTNGKGRPIPYLAAVGETTVDYRAVFSRRKDYQTVGLTYKVEFSTLESGSLWVASTATPTTMDSSDPAIDVVHVPYLPFIQTTNGFEKPRFFRVGVTAP
jgi:hypothetical protein